jgi:hypothetical protein
LTVLLHLGFSITRSEELAFVNHVHEFNPSDDASGVVERLKAKHGLYPKLNLSMILFHDVVQILRRADADWILKAVMSGTHARKERKQSI